MPDKLAPRNWPNWLRIVTLVVSGVWIVSIPLLFRARLRMTWMPWVGVVSVILLVAVIAVPTDDGAATAEPTTVVTATVASDTTEPEPTAATETLKLTPTPPPPPPAPTPPAFGDPVVVGSLELTAVSVALHTSASQFDDSNWRLVVRMRKLKGETYTFSGRSTFTVIDSDGVGHNADRFCSDCPENLFEEGTFQLFGHTTVDRSVYFTITTEARPVELRYAPSSFTDPVRILLVA